MTEGTEPGGAGNLPVGEVHVGQADSGRLHPHPDLAGPRLRNRDVRHLKRVRLEVELRRPHCSAHCDLPADQAMP
jgi:hypothetical protein